MGPILRSSRHTQLPTLPTETWVAILGEHGLSYHDLHRMAMTSKEYRTLLQSRPFDRVLFRGTPAPALTPRSTVTLHPLLLLGASYVKGDIERFIIHSRKKFPRSSWPISGLQPQVTEFATSPPVSKLALKYRGKQFLAQNTDGVDVWDVLFCVTEMWYAYSQDVCENCGGDNCLPLMDEYGWIGWNVSVTSDGMVVLSPQVVR